jgi:hypothetical protein
MADYVIPPNNITSGPNDAVDATDVAGVDIAGGQAVYVDTNSKVQLALADTLPHAAVVGIACAALTKAGQRCPIVKNGATITVTGATFVVGAPLLVSPTNPGGLCPEADVVAGKFVTQVGRFITATSFKLQIYAWGIAHG